MTSVSFRHKHCFNTLNDSFTEYLIKMKLYEGDIMKVLSASIFIIGMTSSALFAGNCAKHNKANLEAMACESGFVWNEAKAECVQDTA